MQVEMAERVALLVGKQPILGPILAATLTENGAVVLEAATPGAADAAIAQHHGLDCLVVFVPSVGSADFAALSAGLIERLATRSGRIVAIVPAAGLVPVRGQGASASESASVIAQVRTLAMDLAPRGIAANALACGPIGETNFNLVSHTALKRPGTAAEVAAAALFLLDPENSYMTGQVLAVDGGWTAGFARDF